MHRLVRGLVLRRPCAPDFQESTRMTPASDASPVKLAQNQAARTFSLREWSERNASLICLWIIIACGFWLRFLHLGTPSLWWNEHLVPLTARFPLAYIFDWTRLCEIHPPYLYMFTKFVLLMDDSDFTLRLFPALTGVAAIVVAYKGYRGILGENGALVLAAFIAVNPLHLFLSRQLRPYAPFMLLYLLKLPVYFALFERSTSRRQAGLFALNLLMFSLNYLSFLLVFCETIILALGLLLRSRPWLRTSFLYGLLGVASSLPVLWPFLSRSAIIKAEINPFTSTAADTVRISLDNIGKALYFFENPLLVGAIGCMAALGFVLLWRRNRVVAAVTMALIVTPLVVLILGKYGYDFRPWNAVFLIPLLLMPVACCAAGLLRSAAAARIFAAALAVSGMVHITSQHWEAYYTEYSGIEGGYLKPMGRRQASFLVAGEPLACLDSGQSSALGWYFSQWFQPSPLANQHVGQDRKETRFVLAGYRDDAPAGRAEVLDQFTIRGVTAARLRVPFERPSIVTLPSSVALNADPYSVYSKASEITDASPCYGMGYQFMPSRHNAPTMMLFEVDNANASRTQQLKLDLNFHNHGEGNSFRLQGRFDAEEWQDLFTQEGPTKSGQAVLTFRRFSPYKRLALRVVMLAVPVSPSYPGDNLESVAFKGLRIDAAPLHGDLFKPVGLDPTISMSGLNSVESEQHNHWRWAVGKSSTVSFDAPPGRDHMTLRFAVNNPIPGQKIDVLVNGVRTATLQDLPAHPWMRAFAEQELRIPVTPGQNVLEFAYSMQNGHGFVFNDKDSTPYAVAFTRLELDF